MSSILKVNLNNIKYNINELKSLLKEDVKNLVMLKADAYGAGAIEVAKYIEKHGLANYIGVAYVSEAIELRENGINLPIVIFTQIINEEIDSIIKYEFIQTISNIEILKKIDKKAKKENKKIKVHLAIDTGMNRLGFKLENIDMCIKEIKHTTNIIYEGIYTHFSSATTNQNYTEKQIEKFENILEIFNKNEIIFNIVHACNTAGIINYKKAHYNMVRMGIGAYGYYPDSNIKGKVNLKASLTLTTNICEIKSIAKGESISYDRKYIANRNMVIAVIQIGYADGLRRGLSELYEVYIKGEKARVVGNICMDMCMIDVTDIVNKKIKINYDDEVVIFENYYNVNKMAEILDTINYEILTGIGKRVKREYIENH